MNWILCPCRNGLQLTLNAVRTFLDQDVAGGVRVLLVDNASTDGTGAWAAAQYPQVEVWRMHDPKSVAESWNLGLDYLFGFVEDAGAVLVVNNDVELRPDTYRRLLDDGGGFVTAVGSRDRRKIDPPHTAPSAETRPHPDFSCYLIRRAVWDTVGKFDERFLGGYVEDGDFHLRLHREGIVAYCLDLPFYHVASGTIKHASDEEAKRIRIRADENRVKFHEKWGFDMGSPEYYAAFGHAAPEREP